MIEKRQGMSLTTIAGVFIIASITFLSLTSSVGAAEFTIRAATIVAPSFPYVPGLMKFKEIVEKETNGRVEVKIFHSGQLGAERDINEGMQQGTIQMGIGAGALANFAPIYNIVSLPFVLKNQQHMHRLAKGKVGIRLAELIEKQAKFKVFDYYSTGDSAIQTAKVPVKTPDDLKGLKIRVMETPSLVNGLKALGANPTPMPYTEIYMALKNGVLDGCIVDLLSVQTMKLYETIKYSTDLELAFSAAPRPVIMPVKYYNSLPKDIQKAVSDSVKSSAEFERQLFIEKLTAIMGELKQKGIIFTSLDANAIMQKIQPVWDTEAKRYGEDGAWFLQEIKAARPN